MRATDDGGAAVGAGEPFLTLGTAGHIDHGKTALVKLLTGKDTDRLREEHERGISIELGYAELDLPSGRRLSVVDVPGHERFVRTMVAGATGIDLFLLVVAADDGVMPQTVEHLAVIDLLGVTDGVVALTKADLVDDELLELVRTDTAAFLAGTPFRDAPVVTVSARDGRGVSDLLAALDEVAGRVRGERREGAARLPIDRVFPLKGIGTVVTGTLWRGALRAGDEVSVEPRGGKATVRSVQVHDQATETAMGGGRVGVNLRGVDAEEVGRGQWLIGRGAPTRVTRRFDAWVRVLPGARPLRADAPLRLHHGTAQFVARLTVFEGREIAAGAEAPAVVRLDGEAAVEAHDRFVLRALSPVETVGGGRILDVAPRRWRSREAHAAYLRALAVGDDERACGLLLAERGTAGVTAGDVAGAGFTTEGATTAMTSLVSRGEAARLGAGGRERWFAAGTLERAREALARLAAANAAARPERPFSAASELAAAVPGLPPDAAAALLDGLVAEGRLVAVEGGYTAAGVSGTLSSAQGELAAVLLERIAAEPFSPPTLATLTETTGRDARELAPLLDALTRRGDLVRTEKDLWFATPAVAEARERLLAMLAGDGEVTLAGFRDALASGRRSAQSLLELFDREGLTRRRGDVRVARRPRRQT